MTYLSLTKYVENLNTEYYKTLLRKIKGPNKRIHTHTHTHTHTHIYIYIYVYGLVDPTVLTYESPY